MLAKKAERAMAISQRVIQQRSNARLPKENAIEMDPSFAFFIYFGLRKSFEIPFPLFSANFHSVVFVCDIVWHARPSCFLTSAFSPCHILSSMKDCFLREGIISPEGGWGKERGISGRNLSEEIRKLNWTNALKCLCKGRLLFPSAFIILDLFLALKLLH
ncbi:hypothetical protein AVEN_27419-1 [Araneus ventricosus]|uniref:Uncharacterized protein n=1 Tax=Araneus ventricosus TaxID=182803 RepID=A0A4Y2EGU5_ARAVE|nr:hypothetical protein AVEN_27419-1 [Araneus ventricosus]